MRDLFFFSVSLQDKERSQQQAGEMVKELILEEAQQEAAAYSSPRSNERNKRFDWIKINMTKGAAAHSE